jgi:hypothetical protein
LKIGLLNAYKVDMERISCLFDELMILALRSDEIIAKLPDDIDSIKFLLHTPNKRGKTIPHCLDRKVPGFFIIQLIYNALKLRYS